MKWGTRLAPLAVPLAAAWAALAVAPLLADSPLPFPRTETREPCASHDPLHRPFFGDPHVHTALSFDAFGHGTRAQPDDSYGYAQGEAIAIQPYGRDGRPLRHVQIRPSLDFAAVTDHSELLGETHMCQLEALEGYDATVSRVMRRLPKLGRTRENEINSRLPSPLAGRRPDRRRRGRGRSASCVPPLWR